MIHINRQGANGSRYLLLLIFNIEVKNPSLLNLLSHFTYEYVPVNTADYLERAKKGYSPWRLQLRKTSSVFYKKN